jgi:hypothetical protein
VKPYRAAGCKWREVIKMTRTHTRIGIFLLAGLLAFTMLAVADGSPAPLGIVPTPTPAPLSVSIWVNKANYMIGENVTIHFNVSQAAFIYIYDIQPDGIVRLIFPNAYSQNNYVSAGTHSLPDGLYKFTVAPPTGTEQLQIFASPTYLDLAPMSYREPYPMIAGDPNAANAEINAHIMGITPEPFWTTAWTSFLIIGPGYGYTPPTYTVPPTYPTPPAYPMPPTYPTPPSFYSYPPFPGFPGGTWYWGNGTWIYGIPPSGWYWYFGADGDWHIRIRISLNFFR